MQIDQLRSEFMKLQEQMYRVYATMETLQTSGPIPAPSPVAPAPAAPVSDQPVSTKPAAQSSNSNSTSSKKIPINKQIESLLQGSDKPLRTKEIIAKLATAAGKTPKEMRNSVSTTINLMKKNGRITYHESAAGPKSGGYSIAAMS